MKDENQEQIKLPSMESFLVKDRFFAGTHPCYGYDETKYITAKLEQFANFGITHFVDLTEEGECKEYNDLLQPWQKHLRIPFHAKLTLTSFLEVRNVFLTIYDILEENSSNQVFLHCKYGLGRVGTVLGCMLADESDKNYPQVKKELDDLLSVSPRLYDCSLPGKPEQCAFIRRFIEESNTHSQRIGIRNEINSNGADIAHLMESFRDDQELYDSVLVYPHKISLLNSRRCRHCGGPLIKMYYSSSDDSWNNLAGREGELIVCEKCKEWDDFNCFVMN